MSKILEISLIVLAALAVGLADIIIKKETFSVDSLSAALKNPLTILIILLYCVQIVIFSFLFVRKAELGIVGIMQTALYAVIVVASGILFFHEKITLIHMVGVALAILGVVFVNL